MSNFLYVHEPDCHEPVYHEPDVQAFNFSIFTTENLDNNVPCSLAGKVPLTSLFFPTKSRVRGELALAPVKAVHGPSLEKFLKLLSVRGNVVDLFT